MKINALTTKYTIFTRDAKEMNNEHSYIRRYTFKIEKKGEGLFFHWTLLGTNSLF